MALNIYGFIKTYKALRLEQASIEKHKFDKITHSAASSFSQAQWPIHYEFGAENAHRLRSLIWISKWQMVSGFPTLAVASTALESEPSEWREHGSASSPPPMWHSPFDASPTAFYPQTLGTRSQLQSLPHI